MIRDVTLQRIGVSGPLDILEQILPFLSDRSVFVGNWKADHNHKGQDVTTSGQLADQSSHSGQGGRAETWESPPIVSMVHGLVPAEILKEYIL